MFESNGGDHTALRNPGDRLGVDPLLHHTRPQPAPQQFEYPPIRDPLSHHPQQLLLIDLAARAILPTPRGPAVPDPEPGLADMAFAVK